MAKERMTNIDLALSLQDVLLEQNDRLQKMIAALVKELAEETERNDKRIADLERQLDRRHLGRGGAELEM